MRNRLAKQGNLRFQVIVVRRAELTTRASCTFSLMCKHHNPVRTARDASLAFACKTLRGHAPDYQAGACLFSYELTPHGAVETSAGSTDVVSVFAELSGAGKGSVFGAPVRL